MIERIVEKDLDNCYEGLRSNPELKENEKRLYRIIDKLDKEIGLELEDIFSSYTAKAVRIGYVQGIKDFNEMFVEIKGNVNEIIEEVEKGIK